jgi:hypothetical protein
MAHHACLTRKAADPVTLEWVTARLGKPIRCVTIQEFRTKIQALKANDFRLDHYSRITNCIVAELEKGCCPWSRHERETRLEALRGLWTVSFSLCPPTGQYPRQSRGLDYVSRSKRLERGR